MVTLTKRFIATPRMFLDDKQIEAVGHNYLGTFFASCDALLAPGGVMVMQAITTPEERYEEYIRSTDFINTIIFPGQKRTPILHSWVVPHAS